MISMDKKWWFKPVDLGSCTSTPQFLSFSDKPTWSPEPLPSRAAPLGGPAMGRTSGGLTRSCKRGKIMIDHGSGVSYNFSDIPILASSHVNWRSWPDFWTFLPSRNGWKLPEMLHMQSWRKSTKVINMTEETSITSILFTPLPFLRTWWPPLAPSAKRCSISRGTRLWSPKFAMFFSVNLVCSGVANWFIIAKWSQLGNWTLDKSYTCSSEIKEIGLSGEGSGPNWTWCAKI